jgi:hypothetical protein
MMECWNDGMLVFKGSSFFINIMNSLIDMDFTNKPHYHFPITQYSIVPLFQHSNCRAKFYNLGGLVAVLLKNGYLERRWASE